MYSEGQTALLIVNFYVLLDSNITKKVFDLLMLLHKRKVLKKILKCRYKLKLGVDFNLIVR